MIVNIKDTSVDACVNTRARMAKRSEENVDETAANCGDLPNGAATNKDQLARDSLGLLDTTKSTQEFKKNLRE